MSAMVPVISSVTVILLFRLPSATSASSVMKRMTAAWLRSFSSATSCTCLALPREHEQQCDSECCRDPDDRQVDIQAALQRGQARQQKIVELGFGGDGERQVRADQRIDDLHPALRAWGRCITLEKLFAHAALQSFHRLERLCRRRFELLAQCRRGLVRAVERLLDTFALLHLP